MILFPPPSKNTTYRISTQSQEASAAYAKQHMDSTQAEAKVWASVCAPRSPGFTTHLQSLFVSLVWLCLPCWVPTTWHKPSRGHCSSVCGRIWEPGEKGSPQGNPRAGPAGREENYACSFIENNFAQGSMWMYETIAFLMFDIGYGNLKQEKICSTKTSPLTVGLWPLHLWVL